MNNFEKLKELVADCTAPTAPRMYRALYGMRDDEPAIQLGGWDEWRALPMMNKNTLVETPFADRFFASHSDIEDIRTSSGTSGKKPPFIPRVFPRGLEYRLQYHSFKNPILAFKVPYMMHWHEELQQSLGYAPRVVAFDPVHAEASIRLARIAGVDAIITFAFHIPLIGTLMSREGMTENIRLIEINGENCTRSLFNFMRATFPNAVILPQFGAAEVEDKPLGVPCRAITGEEPLSVYHAKDTQYHEVIDSDTLEVLPYQAGSEGELVVTSHVPKPRATPLIRYRTGDIVKILPEKCAAHNQLQFTIIGRVSIDFVKIPGGVLRADEMERVLLAIDNDISDRFEIHRYVHNHEAGPKIGMVVHITSRTGRNLDMEHIARDISNHFRVGPKRTYAQGVQSGMYVPLSCALLVNSSHTEKMKRIIVHEPEKS